MLLRIYMSSWSGGRNLNSHIHSWATLAKVPRMAPCIVHVKCLGAPPPDIFAAVLLLEERQSHMVPNVDDARSCPITHLVGADLSLEGTTTIRAVSSTHPPVE